MKSSSIVFVLYTALYSQVIYAFASIVVQIASSYTTYWKSDVDFQFMDAAEAGDINLVNSLLWTFFQLSFLQDLVRYMNTYISSKLNNGIQEDVRRSMYNKWKHMKYEKQFFEQQNTLETAIGTGAHAVTGLNRSVFQMINSSFTIATLIYAVSQKANLVYIAGISLILIFSAGIILQVSDYNKRKKMAKDTLYITTLNQDLTKGITTSIVEGTIDNSFNMIINIAMEKANIMLKHSMKYRVWYVSLEILTCLMITINCKAVANILPIEELGQVVVIFKLVTRATWTMWHMFYTASSAQEEIAQYTPAQEFLDTYEPETSYPNCSYINMTMSLQECSDLSSKDLPEILPGSMVRLRGPSGAGKTTFLKRLIIYMMRTFVNVDLHYMEQNPTIAQSEGMSILNFLKGPIDPMEAYSPIIHLAKRLDIDNIINEDTINEKFNSPSGGQQKRIMIIKTILPLYVNEVKDMSNHIFFLDESLANLDHDSKEKVMMVIQDLMNKGAVFLVIDHGDIPLIENIIELDVVSEKVPPIETIIQDKDDSWYNWFMAFFCIDPNDHLDVDIETGLKKKSTPQPPRVGVKNYKPIE